MQILLLTPMLYPHTRNQSTQIGKCEITGCVKIAPTLHHRTCEAELSPSGLPHRQLPRSAGFEYIKTWRVSVRQSSSTLPPLRCVVDTAYRDNSFMIFMITWRSNVRQWQSNTGYGRRTRIPHHLTRIHNVMFFHGFTLLGKTNKQRTIALTFERKIRG